MKQKFVSAAVLAAAALALLLGLVPKGSGPDISYYFRDNTEWAGEQTLICYGKLPYAEERSFGDQEQRLIEEKAVPEMPEYRNFSCTACYDADGGFFEISMHWRTVPQYAGEIYKQMELRIIPGDMGDPKRRDGIVVPDMDQVTVTETGGVTVYGCGTVEPVQIGDRAVQHNNLIFTKNDVRYQIGSGQGCTLEEMGRVLDFYLKNDLDLAAFSPELGDEFTHGDLAENPNAFPGCIPDTAGLQTENGEWYILKNGKPYSYEMGIYGTDEAEGAQMHWCVGLVGPDTESAGTVEEITEAEFRGAVAPDVLGIWRVALLQGPFVIEVVSFRKEPPLDLMWQLVKTLK